MMRITVDHRKIQRKLQRLQEGLKPKQVAGVMNAAIQSTRGYASRLARSIVNWKAKQVFESVTRNTKGDMIRMYKTSGGELSVSLFFTSTERNIETFGARKLAKGASVTTWKNRGRQRYPHAWQMKMTPGPWFERLGTERIPFRSVRGPSMAEAMKPVAGAVRDFASKRMEAEYLRKIRGALARG